MKSNPFATRHVSPGRVPWIAACEHTTLGALSIRVQALKFRAAIVGPHGSGKSTLLEHLLPPFGTIAYRERLDGSTIEFDPSGKLVWLQLRKSADPAAQIRRSRPHWQAGRVLILDGFEQLNLISRWRQVWATRSCAMGLIVTSHSSIRMAVPLPRLCKTSIGTAQAQAILQRVLASDFERDASSGTLEMGPLNERLVRHRGNMREVLMDYYDAFQRVPQANCHSAACENGLQGSQ